jgi:galactitol-specific phosphotransferase system IIC component
MHSIILLNDIPISSDSDLSVPKHQVLKISVENLLIPLTPLALALVLGGNTVNPRRDRGSI